MINFGVYIDELNKFIHLKHFSPLVNATPTETVAIFFGKLTYKKLSEPIHLNGIVITVMC